MKKIILQKTHRETVQALVLYLAGSEAFVGSDDMAVVAICSLMYKLRLRLFNTLASQRSTLTFQITLERHDAAAFLKYYEDIPLNGLGKLDKILIQELAAKLDVKIIENPILGK